MILVLVPMTSGSLELAPDQEGPEPSGIGKLTVPWAKRFLTRRRKSSPTPLAPMWAGTGVVLNTSFNVHGDPLVCSPADAIETLKKTGNDYLIMGRYLVKRS